MFSIAIIVLGIIALTLIIVAIVKGVKDEEKELNKKPTKKK